jgi:lysophospholipase L1-like esterase
MKTFLMVCICTSLAVTAAEGRGSPRLRRMVAVGDSLFAGFGSGGLIGFGRPGQVDSAPAFIARRARVRLPLPLVTRPGLPPQLTIVDGNLNRQLDPGEVRRRDSGLGFRADPDREARNLAVPGEDMTSVFTGIAPEEIAGQIASGDVDGRDLLKFIILGLPLRGERVSQPSRARDLRPSFILVWIGNNDLLAMATRTDPAAETLTRADFATRFRRLLDALADSGADMAVANLPDPTGIAALRRAAGEVTSCRTPAGTTEPVAADALLSIDLDRALLPVPPCGKVLDAAERAQVRATVDGFNAEIAAAVADTSAARGVAIVLVDLARQFDEIGTRGVDLDGDGTADLTARYLGGLFSLDGIHPTRTGNALIANAFIDAINARFGDGIRRVNLARIAAHDPLAHSRFRPAGEPPFGLIAEPGDELADFFTGIFDRIARDVEDLRDRLDEFL